MSAADGRRTPGPPRTVHVERVMGTVVSFDLEGAGEHATAVAEAVRELHRIDAAFSTWRPDSAVSRFDRGELGPDRISAELEHVLAVCADVEVRSAGAFSARARGRLDPSAYVKGWAVERAAGLLEAHGCDDWAVNAGGDVLTRRVRSAAPRVVGVRHPLDPDALATTLPAWDLAVATSGRYERGDHLVDPRSGRPARGALSTTVTGPDLGLADAYATAAFVLGAAGPAWVAGLPGYECWSAFQDGSVVATAGFPRFVQGVPVTAVPAADRSGS